MANTHWFEYMRHEYYRYVHINVCVHVCRFSTGMVLSLLPLYVCYIRLSWFYSSVLNKKYRMCAHTYAVPTSIHTYINISVAIFNVRTEYSVFQKKWSEIDLTWLDLTEWIAWKRTQIASMWAYVYLCVVVVMWSKREKKNIQNNAQLID